MTELVTSHEPKRHPNLKGESPRIRLGGGPFVDIKTLAQLAEWQRRGPSYGEIIDRLAVFAAKSGFDPVSCTTQYAKTGAPGITRKRRSTT